MCVLVLEIRFLVIFLCVSIFFLKIKKLTSSSLHFYSVYVDNIKSVLIFLVKAHQLFPGTL